MNAVNREINVVEQLIVILDGEAGAHEHHDLLLPILLQECEQQHESLLARADHVALLQTGDGGGAPLLAGVVNTDVDRLLLQGHLDQVVGLFGRRGGEQHGLAFF